MRAIISMIAEVFATESIFNLLICPLFDFEKLIKNANLCTSTQEAWQAPLVSRAFPCPTLCPLNYFQWPRGECLQHPAETSTDGIRNAT
jgi:hypothetical protein